MKKESLIMIGCLALGLIIMSQCKGGEGEGKPLFHQDNGNYVVDNNFIVKSAVPMSAQDIQQLITLDTAYAQMTKGVAILTHVSDRLNILHINQIQQLDKIVRLQQIDKIQKILDFQKGCLQVANIDWAQFGDLKVKLDAILTKYKPVTVDGNYSIYNNQIATSVGALDAKVIGTLNELTIRGANEIDICGDYMGPKTFTNVLLRTQGLPFDQARFGKVNKLLMQYR